MEKAEFSYKTILDYAAKLSKNSSSFSGSGLLDYLEKENNPSKYSRSQLLEIIRTTFSNPTLNDQLIYPLKADTIFEDKSSSQYRFIKDEFEVYSIDPKVINMYGIKSEEHFFYEYSNPKDRPDDKIASDIKETITELYSEFLVQDGSEVDYINLGKSNTFNEKYLPLVKKLAYADLSNLVGKDDEIKAFFINIYNALNIHAHFHEISKNSNFKKTVMNMGAFYSGWKYCIGGHLYSLDDIEHGILRKNNGKSSLWDIICSRVKERWPETSPKRKLVVHTLDPRIHFTLNCGAKSCPPINVYEAKEIEKQLDLATKAFVKGTVIEESNGNIKITASKLLDWYKSDFGRNVYEVIGFLVKYLRDKDMKERIEKLLEGDRKKLSLRYSDYDWSTNIKSK